MRCFMRLVPWLAVVTLMSCASTSELVRRGERALDSGNMEQAYDWSRRALDREPGNPRARTIMATAADSIIDAREAEVGRLAGTDTVAAARAVLELDDFHAEVARHHVTLAPDPEFDAQAAAIRMGAARLYYDQGVRSLAADFPKRACGELSEAERFAPGDRDIAGQLARARERAVTPIALLPFNNEVSAPELSRQLSDEILKQMRYQLTASAFRFTRLIGEDQVNAQMTVAEAGRLTREDAVRLGRALGARRVVLGRIHDLRSDTRTDTYHEPIYHRAERRGEDGKPHARYDEERFEAVSRERQVSIVLDVEVIETAGGGRLASHSEERGVAAHTVFTRFLPDGSCDDYAIAPPDWKDSERGSDREKEWHERFGSWTLPSLLDQARRNPGRTRYEPRYRPEFSVVGTNTPVWLDDLPPVEELAHIALADSWLPMVAMLRELDAKDDLEILGGQ
jgi:hypothetical protein